MLLEITVAIYTNYCKRPFFCVVTQQDVKQMPKAKSDQHCLVLQLIVQKSGDHHRCTTHLCMCGRNMEKPPIEIPVGILRHRLAMVTTAYSQCNSKKRHVFLIPPSASNDFSKKSRLGESVKLSLFENSIL